MPRQSTLYGMVIVLLVVIVILGGYVGWTLVTKPSSTQPSPSAAPTPSPSLTPTTGVFSTASPVASQTPQPTTLDQIRDATMVYIAANHPETAPIMTNLNWTVQNQTSDPWSEISVYNSSDWTAEINNVDTRSQTYVISANYSGAVYVTWTGMFQNGGFTETKYLTDIGEQTQILNQAQVRDEIMNYIRTAHPETAQFMTALTWSGGRGDTPSSIVEQYDYFSGNITENASWGWTVNISYSTMPAVSNPLYMVKATYVGPVAWVYWEGSCRTGVVTETSYTFTP